MITEKMREITINHDAPKVFYGTLTSRLLSETVIAPAKELKMKQESYIEKSPKRSLMKTLFITPSELVSISIRKNEKVYKFISDLFTIPFYLIEDRNTMKLSLFQGDFLLEENQGPCQILLNKIT